MLITTRRLVLRPWNVSDLKPFAELNANLEVRKYFSSILTEEQSNALVKTFENHFEKYGWGFFAVNLRETDEFIGMIGLNHVSFKAPFCPAVEIGWRLSVNHWNKGYAKEGALACLKYAFEKLKLNEIVAFAATQNLRSQAVMQKIGMHNSNQNFQHPNVPIDSPLREQVLYKMTSRDWLNYIN